jgi:uncharacterized protein (TIGR03435 family)
LKSTGQTGTYSFDARWQTNGDNLSSHKWEYDGVAPPPMTQQGPVSRSFAEALRSKLDLTVEPPGDHQVQFIVVDRVEQPTTEG